MIIKKRQANKQTKNPHYEPRYKSFEQVKGNLICRSDSKSHTFFYCLCILANIVTLQNQYLKLHARYRKMNIKVVIQDN